MRISARRLPWILAIIATVLLATLLPSAAGPPAGCLDPGVSTCDEDDTRTCILLLYNFYFDKWLPWPGEESRCVTVYYCPEEYREYCGWCDDCHL